MQKYGSLQKVMSHCCKNMYDICNAFSIRKLQSSIFNFRILIFLKKNSARQHTLSGGHKTITYIPPYLAALRYSLGVIE